VKVKGKWMYEYRAIDKALDTLEFMVLAHRDCRSSRRFFKKTIGTNAVPDRVVIDKSGSNLAALT
jgi:putative transposase